mgnify:CR=1 FL=1
MGGLSVSFLLALVVVGAGVSVALQQVLNANLRAALGSPWLAGFVSYAVGTMAMLAAGLASGLPALSRVDLARVPWISWTGGVFGAVFIGTLIFLLPRFGAATALALVVVGQMAASLVLDHVGAFGLTQQSVATLSHPAAVAG